MSISNMIDTKLLRERPPASERAPAPASVPVSVSAPALETAASSWGPSSAPASGTSGGSAVDTGLMDQLTRWIPSETLVLYVAFLGVIGDAKTPADYAGRWVAIGIFIAVTIGFTVLIGYGRARGRNEPYRVPVFETVVAAFSFLAWAVALPDTPLNGIEGYNQSIGGFALLSATIGVASVAKALGKSPTIAKSAAG